MEAEAYSNAPGLLRRGLSELLQHLLATFTTILQEQLPGEFLVLPKRPQFSRSICKVQVLMLATSTTTLLGQLPGGRPHFCKMPPLMASRLLGIHIMEQTLGCSLKCLPTRARSTVGWEALSLQVVGCLRTEQAAFAHAGTNVTRMMQLLVGPKLLRWTLLEPCSVQITFSLVLSTKGTEGASCAETNLGGTLQLLVDLKFLAGAFSPLVKAPHEASISACRQTIVDQAVALAKGQGEREDPLAERLEEWLSSCEVSCRLA